MTGESGDDGGKSEEDLFYNKNRKYPVAHAIFFYAIFYTYQNFILTTAINPVVIHEKTIFLTQTSHLSGAYCARKTVNVYSGTHDRKTKLYRNFEISHDRKTKLHTIRT